jgi:hypothetical protein
MHSSTGLYIAVAACATAAMTTAGASILAAKQTAEVIETMEKIGRRMDESNYTMQHYVHRRVCSACQFAEKAMPKYVRESVHQEMQDYNMTHSRGAHVAAEEAKEAVAAEEGAAGDLDALPRVVGVAADSPAAGVADGAAPVVAGAGA